MKLTKFKVWDGNKLHEVDSINFNESYPGGFQCVTVKDGEGINTLFQAMSDALLHIEGHYNLELLQYTGLKDKNGKGICEGDIYHQGDPKITYTVVCHDTGFKGKQNSSSSYAGLDHWQERIEVIGNIYQNPELAGGKFND